MTDTEVQTDATYEIKNGDDIVGTAETLAEAEEAALDHLAPYRDRSRTVCADIYKDSVLVESLCYMTDEDLRAEVGRAFAEVEQKLAARA